MNRQRQQVPRVPLQVADTPPPLRQFTPSSHPRTLRSSSVHVLCDIAGTSARWWAKDQGGVVRGRGTDGRSATERMTHGKSPRADADTATATAIWRRLFTWKVALVAILL